MESSLAEFPSPQTSTACNQGCRYAGPVRGEYPDWIWCTHPLAEVRLRSTSFECRRFEPALAKAIRAGSP